MNRSARRKQAQRDKIKGAKATGALMELHLAARAAELTPEERAEAEKKAEQFKVWQAAQTLRTMGLVLPGTPEWNE